MSVLRFRDSATNEQKENTTVILPSGANEISYDNTESQIEGVETVQKALDHLFDTTIDATYLENLGYQTEAQVNALIATALNNLATNGILIQRQADSSSTPGDITRFYVE